jgi:hypothetical protein
MGSFAKNTALELGQEFSKKIFYGCSVLSGIYCGFASAQGVPPNAGLEAILIAGPPVANTLVNSGLEHIKTGAANLKEKSRDGTLGLFVFAIGYGIGYFISK